ncbi:hypothetical protein HMPREF1640_08050 [Prevotella sp. S7-1-8]|nr:hypothetical protein HMPREF1640_08050 [Prevotella sp. S7-1-8]
MPSLSQIKVKKNKHFSTACFSGLKRARGARATPSGSPWKARAIPSRHDAIAFDARWCAV